jgi:hypothetical protein
MRKPAPTRRRRPERGIADVGSLMPLRRLSLPECASPDGGQRVRAAILLLPSRSMEIDGVRITTIVKDNVAIRCDGCLEVIAGTPWRVNLLDIVAAEKPASWTDSPAINPGPFQFHADPSHVRSWMADRGYFFCRRGQVREIMRPIPIPTADGVTQRWGLCDGIHRDDHEFVPA